MTIEKASLQDMEEFGRLWLEEETRRGVKFLRPVSSEYFIHKYFGTSGMRSFIIICGKEIIGFFGVLAIEQNDVSTMAFSDFIIKPAFRGKGYLTEIVGILQNEVFTTADALIFYPIDRTAMISWKFSLKPQITEKLNRWILDLKQVKGSLEKYEFSITDISGPYGYEKQISVDRNAVHLGYIVVNEVDCGPCYGLELCSINNLSKAVNSIQTVLQELLGWLKMKQYSFFVIKLSADSKLCKWIESMEPPAEKEVLYKFLICNEAKKQQLEDWNPETIGEVVDAPRYEGRIRKFLLETGTSL